MRLDENLDRAGADYLWTDPESGEVFDHWYTKRHQRGMYPSETPFTDVSTHRARTGSTTWKCRVIGQGSTHGVARTEES